MFSEKDSLIYWSSFRISYEDASHETTYRCGDSNMQVRRAFRAHTPRTLSLLLGHNGYVAQLASMELQTIHGSLIQHAIATSIIMSDTSSKVSGRISSSTPAFDFVPAHEQSHLHIPIPSSIMDEILGFTLFSPWFLSAFPHPPIYYVLPY